MHTYTHRRQKLFNQRKHHPPTHLEELRVEQILKAGHNVKRKLEDMIASLLNHLQVFSKQNVQYVAWYFETHTNLNVVVPTSATHVVTDLKLNIKPVRHAGKTTLNSIITRAWNAPSHNFTFYAHTVRVAAHGEENWGSWSITWVKSRTLVSLESGYCCMIGSFVAVLHATGIHQELSEASNSHSQ